MRFQTPLVPARLIRRYKRFLADCRLEDGREITAHCANPGSMMGLADEGQRIWLEPNDDPKKKLKFGWRLVDHGAGRFTGVDTSLPNKLVREALEAGQIAELTGFESLKTEVKYSEGSRIDFLLSQSGHPDTYVEVKSVTLSRHKGLAEFPDSVTARGAKHLGDLTQMVQQGHRAVMLYVVQRNDCTQMRLADDLDPAYAAAFAEARKAGVEALCYGTDLSPDAITVAGAVIGP